jgi:hypothetical protein
MAAQILSCDYAEIINDRRRMRRFRLWQSGLRQIRVTFSLP